MKPTRSENANAAIKAQKSVIIVRTDSEDSALSAVEAVIKAGLRVIDIPVTVPGVNKIIEKIASRKNVIAGAGSVTTMHEAADAISAGASFIICPHTDRTIIDYCRDNNIFVTAGGMTPTEAMVAYLAGVDLVALYPVHLIGGAEYVQQLRKPMPFLQLMSVGGITIENVPDHIRNGACAVGVTESIIDPMLVRNRDWDEIHTRAKAYFEVIDKLDGGC